MGRGPRPAIRAHGRRGATRAGRVAGCGRARVAPRVRERRKPDARTGYSSRKRAHAPLRARRRPGAIGGRPPRREHRRGDARFARRSRRRSGDNCEHFSFSGSAPTPCHDSKRPVSTRACSPLPCVSPHSRSCSSVFFLRSARHGRASSFVRARGRVPVQGKTGCEAFSSWSRCRSRCCSSSAPGF